MIKELTSFVIVGVLMSSGFGFLVMPEIDRNDVSDKTVDCAITWDDTVFRKEETITLSDLVLTTEDEYIMAHFDEETSILMDPGKPALPVVTKVFTFPFGVKIEDVEVAFANIETHILPKKIQPSSKPMVLSLPEHSIETDEDEGIYSGSTRYPLDNHVVSGGAGLEDNTHVVYLSIQCNPVKYAPGENKLFFAKTITILISYKMPERPVVFADEYDLLIISPTEFSSSLQPLIDHKNSVGMQTVLKTTEAIYAGYTGRDNAEQIKQCIKDAVEAWGIKYVLLVGDIYKLPIRNSAVSWYNFNELPTDLYYADIYDINGSYCDWDSNGNNHYGEFVWDINNGRIEYIDSVDLFPDVGIGRVPCSTSDEVDVIVSKIMTYETQTRGEEWFNRVILMGGDTFPNWGGIEGEIVTDYISQVMDEFTSKKLWTSTRNFRPYLINKELSAGAGFVSYSGHGYEYGFGTSPPNNERRIQYYTPYLLGLNNENKLPIIFFDACLTATLDFPIGGFRVPCFAWCIVKKPNGGAVSAIGATRVAYASVMEGNIQAGAARLNVYFFENYEQESTVSEMLIKAQNDYLNFCWKDCLTLEEYNLIGDPSLKIGGY